MASALQIDFTLSRLAAVLGIPYGGTGPAPAPALTWDDNPKAGGIRIEIAGRAVFGPKRRKLHEWEVLIGFVVDCQYWRNVYAGEDTSQ